MRTWVLFAAFGMSGCATSQYGREQPLIAQEKAAYDCPMIAVEIAKVDSFMRETWQTWNGTKGRRFLGFFGDLNIGDRRARSDAIDSAETRRSALVELAHQKHCPEPPPIPVDE